MPHSACRLALRNRPLARAFRGQQKGKSRLLKTLAHPRAQALKLLEEGQFGIVMFQGVGDKMAHIADPRRPIGASSKVSTIPFLISEPQSLTTCEGHPQRSKSERRTVLTVHRSMSRPGAGQ